MIKMKILFVCPCWPGIAEAYNEGKEPNGMPGFFNVICELIRRGHEVDLFIYTVRKVELTENQLPSEHWFSKVRIVGIFSLKNYRKIKKVLYEFQFFCRISEESYIRVVRRKGR